MMAVTVDFCRIPGTNPIVGEKGDDGDASSLF
jgi:hypothetical protein